MSYEFEIIGKECEHCKFLYETFLKSPNLYDDGGKDYNGRKAVSGVYFVFSTGRASFDTPDSFVTKIMIVN